MIQLKNTIHGNIHISDYLKDLPEILDRAGGWEFVNCPDFVDWLITLVGSAGFERGDLAIFCGTEEGVGFLTDGMLLLIAGLDIFWDLLIVGLVFKNEFVVIVDFAGREILGFICPVAGLVATLTGFLGGNGLCKLPMGSGVGGFKELPEEDNFCAGGVNLGGRGFDNATGCGAVGFLQDMDAWLKNIYIK